ncbi:MAG: transglutaminase domain-containing protein [Pseudomonadales bacterium]|nr:transglutaminase domain-containing protein [Pseudomonadales bacterium]
MVLAVGIALIGSVWFWNTQNQPIHQRLAAGMSGENWFRIELEGRHVGYMYNHAKQSRNGTWTFNSTTHFLLQNNSPNTINKQLTFAAYPPYPLQKALFQSASGDTTEVLPAEMGYIATVRRGTQTSQIPLDWSFSMADFLAFEAWLIQDQPNAEASFSVRDPDFEKLRIAQRSYRVLSKNEQGYLIETNSMLAPTVTQLDHNYRPINLTMSGVFQIKRASELEAVAIQQMQSKTSYLFSVDRRLSDHTRINALSLKTHNATNVLPDILALTRGNRSTPADPNLHIGEELKYPISARKIQKLLQQAVAQTKIESTTDARALADQLVALVHQKIQYSENNPAMGVLKALSRGFGECTDFADLLTTLARAGRIPARTVFGLAYRDGPKPVFMYHAWNELYVDKQWIAVDPTWNQTEIDATHIPLSDQQSAAIMLAHARKPIHFEVVDANYL